MGDVGVKDISSSSGGVFQFPAFTSTLSSGARFVPAVPPGSTVTRGIETTLRRMATTHNALHGEDPAKRADVRALRTVYRRGARSYKRKPGGSRRGHAFARVRAHLAMLATGKRANVKYTRDDDVLPAGHPLAPAESKRLAVLTAEGGAREPLEQLLAVQVKGLGHDAKVAWDAAKHPRDKHGRFASVGSTVRDDEGRVAKVVAHADNGEVELRDAAGHRWMENPKHTTVVRTAAGQHPAAIDGGRAERTSDAAARGVHPHLVSEGARRSGIYFDGERRGHVQQGPTGRWHATVDDHEVGHAASHDAALEGLREHFGSRGDLAEDGSRSITSMTPAEAAGEAQRLARKPDKTPAERTRMLAAERRSLAAPDGRHYTPAETDGHEMRPGERVVDSEGNGGFVAGYTDDSPIDRFVAVHKDDGTVTTHSHDELTAFEPIGGQRHDSPHYMDSETLAFAHSVAHHESLDPTASPEARAESAGRAALLAREREARGHENPSEPVPLSDLHQQMRPLLNEAETSTPEARARELKTASAARHATRVVSAAREAEPKVTGDLTSLVAEHGGEMQMLQHAVKEHDSLTRKIRDKADAKGMEQREYAQRVGDALRYTAVIPREDYAGGISDTIDGLRSRGYTVDTIENTWARPGAEAPYQAVHIEAVTPGGQRFELQFHTPESIAQKKRQHGDYKVMRDPEVPLEERQQAYDRMVADNAKVAAPSGVHDIGKAVSYSRPEGRPPTQPAKPLRRAKPPAPTRREPPTIGAPPADDLSTPEGLHAHLTSSEHGNANVPEFGPEDHAAYAEMHRRAHELGVDSHSHTEPAGSSPARLSVRAGDYRGESGHTISGTDTRGRRVSVFVPGDRAAADASSANIRAGRSAFDSGGGAHAALEQARADGSVVRMQGHVPDEGPVDFHGRVENIDERGMVSGTAVEHDGSDYPFEVHRDDVHTVSPSDRTAPEPPAPVTSPDDRPTIEDGAPVDEATRAANVARASGATLKRRSNRNGQTRYLVGAGTTVSSEGPQRAVAGALVSAATTGKPHYVEATRNGYGVSDTLVNRHNSHLEVHPNGDVFDVQPGSWIEPDSQHRRTRVSDAAVAQVLADHTKPPTAPTATSTHPGGFGSLDELRTHLQSDAPELYAQTTDRDARAQHLAEIAADKSVVLSPGGTLFSRKEGGTWRTYTARHALSIPHILDAKNKGDATALAARAEHETGFPFGATDAPAQIREWQHPDGGNLPRRLSAMRADFDRSKGLTAETSPHIADAERSAQHAADVAANEQNATAGGYTERVESLADLNPGDEVHLRVGVGAHSNHLSFTHADEPGMRAGRNLDGETVTVRGRLAGEGRFMDRHRNNTHEFMDGVRFPLEGGRWETADGEHRGPIAGLTIPYHAVVYRKPRDQASSGDLSTPEGLHAHLTSAAHGNANVPAFGAADHEAYAEMHQRAHQLGVDSHDHAEVAAPEPTRAPRAAQPGGGFVTTAAERRQREADRQARVEASNRRIATLTFDEYMAEVRRGEHGNIWPADPAEQAKDEAAYRRHWEAMRAKYGADG